MGDGEKNQKNQPRKFWHQKPTKRNKKKEHQAPFF